MDRTGCEIIGIPHVVREITIKCGERKLNAVQALVTGAHSILDLAQERTPVKTGALKATGKVHEPEDRGNETIVLISFGDEEVDYAIPVHERLDVRHIIGQAKFLESAVQEKESELFSLLSKS